MRQKHTSGPWRTIKSRSRVIRIGGPDPKGRKSYYEAVADVRVNDQLEANASLIAAAPELLEAANRVLANAYLDDDVINGKQFTTVGCEALRELLAAVRKAVPHA